MLTLTSLFRTALEQRDKLAIRNYICLVPTLAQEPGVVDFLIELAKNLDIKLFNTLWVSRSCWIDLGSPEWSFLKEEKYKPLLEITEKESSQKLSESSANKISLPKEANESLANMLYVLTGHDFAHSHRSLKIDQQSGKPVLAPHFRSLTKDIDNFTALTTQLDIFGIPYYTDFTKSSRRLVTIPQTALKQIYALFHHHPKVAQWNLDKIKDKDSDQALKKQDFSEIVKQRRIVGNELFKHCFELDTLRHEMYERLAARNIYEVKGAAKKISSNDRKMFDDEGHFQDNYLYASSLSGEDHEDFGDFQDSRLESVLSYLTAWMRPELSQLVPFSLIMTDFKKEDMSHIISSAKKMKQPIFNDLYFPDADSDFRNSSDTEQKQRLDLSSLSVSQKGRLFKLCLLPEAARAKFKKSLSKKLSALEKSEQLERVDNLITYYQEALSTYLPYALYYKHIITAAQPLTFSASLSSCSEKSSASSASLSLEAELSAEDQEKPKLKAQV